jgi:hypothetical protein
LLMNVVEINVLFRHDQSLGFNIKYVDL